MRKAPGVSSPHDEKSRTVFCKTTAAWYDNLSPLGAQNTETSYVLVRTLAAVPMGSRKYLVEMLIDIQTHTIVIRVPLSQYL